MSAREMQQPMLSRIPLYLAALGVGCTGLAGFAMQTGKNNEALLMSALLLIGFASSWATRAGLFRRRNGRGLGLAPWYVWIPPLYAVRYVFQPPILVGDSVTEETSLVFWLAGVTVVWSYLLYTDSAVPLVCVPSLSLISLAIIVQPNDIALPLFTLFLVLSSYVLVQENSLVNRAHEARMAEAKRRRPLVERWAPFLAIGIALVAVVSGVVIGRALHPHLDLSIHWRPHPFQGEPGVQTVARDDYVPVSTGPVELSGREVMVVECGEPLLWRGQTFDVYTEDGWRSSVPPIERQFVRPVRLDHRSLPESSRPLPTSAAHRYDLSSGNSSASGQSAKRVRQTYRQTAVGRSNIVYAAAEPETVIMPIRSYLIQTGGGLKTEEHYAWGLSYEVESVVVAPSPEVLRAASNDYPEAIADGYLAVPQSAWRVGELVRKITKGQTSAYDKAIAIQEFLEDHHTYDIKTPAAPRGQDVVTHFLFKSKRGYCDIFASSMVIMSRYAGIPARWVTGYATGEYEPLDGAYHVRERNAHAWAELYFPGQGWVAFDATASSESSGLMSRIRSLIASAQSYLRQNKPFVIAVGVIILLSLYLLKVEVIDRIRSSRQNAQRGALGTGVLAHYHVMCDHLARYGYPRAVSITPLEYASELRQRFGLELGGVSSLVDSITEAFVERKYAMRQPSAVRDAQVGEELRRLARRLKSAKRRKLLPQ